MPGATAAASAPPAHCGAAVVHLMQPGIRDYYHLEEIWGGKPVRLKLDGAQRGLVKAAEPAAPAAASRPNRPTPAAPTQRSAARKAVTRVVGVKRSTADGGAAQTPVPAKPRVAPSRTKPAPTPAAKRAPRPAAKAPAKPAPRAAAKAAGSAAKTVRRKA